MLSDSNVSDLLALVTRLFPRDNPERIALVESAALLPGYDPGRCEAVVREHACLFEFLNIPKLREAMADAHADPDARARRERDETDRRIAAKAQESADADADFDRVARDFDALRRRQPEFVAELAAAVCEGNPFLAGLVQRRGGVDACHAVKVLVLDAARKGATHAA